MRILLVDDNKYWRADFALWLTEELDHEVVAAEDGDEALRIFGANRDFQVAIVDYSLPGSADGIELLAKLHEVSKDLPVILVTGVGERQVSKNALESGAYWYLEKPIDRTDARFLLGQLAKSEAEKRNGSFEAERETYMHLLGALEESNKKLSEVQKEEELHKTVEKVILSSFRIDTFYLALLHKPTESIYFPVVVDEGKVKPLPAVGLQDEDNLTATIIRQGKEIAVADLRRETKLPARPRVDGRSARAFFGVPLRLSDERCIGALSIQAYEPDRFSTTTRRAIRTLAHQIAFTLDRLTRLGLRESVLEELMAGKALSEVLQGITIALENAVDAKAVMIYPLDPQTGRLAELGVCSNLGSSQAGTRWPLQGGMLEALQRHGGRLTSDAASEDVFSRKLMAKLGATSGYGQILRTHASGPPVGVVTVYYDAPGGLPEVAKQEIEWFARRSALAIYLGQLLEQKRKTDTLHEVERQALRAAGEDAVGREERALKVAAAIGRAWPEEEVDVHLLLADRGRRSLDWVREGEPGLSIRFGDKYCGRVAETGEPVLITEDSSLDASAFLRPEARSTICVPVKFGNSVLGVLAAESLPGRVFTDDDRLFLERVAEQLAVFIVTEGREELREKVISAAVEAATDPENALGIIVRSVHEIASETGGEPTSTTLCLVTDKGLEIVKTFPGREFDSLTGQLGRFLPLEEIPGRRVGVAVRAVLDRKTQSVKDVRSSEDYLDYDPETRAELAVPIYATDRERVLGVLNLEFRKPEALTAENERLVESLADQASVVAVLEQQSRELAEETSRRNEATTLALMGIEALERGHRWKNKAAAVNLNLDNMDRNISRILEARASWYGELLRRLPVWRQVENLIAGLQRIRDSLRFAEKEGLTARPEDVQEIAVKEWAEEIADQWRNRYFELPVGGIRRELSIGDQDRVIANPVLLKRAVDNLIHNAFRSAGKRQNPMVTLRVFPEDDKIRVEVEDNGYGIPNSVSGFLFKSEIPDGTAGLEGRGMGCLLTGFIVRASGGDLRFANLDGGRGARVWLRLPAAHKLVITKDAEESEDVVPPTKAADLAG